MGYQSSYDSVSAITNDIWKRLIEIEGPHVNAETIINILKDVNDINARLINMCRVYLLDDHDQMLAIK